MKVQKQVRESYGHEVGRAKQLSRGHSPAAPPRAPTCLPILIVINQ